MLCITWHSASTFSRCTLFALVFAHPNTLDEKQTTGTDLPQVCLEQVSAKGWLKSYQQPTQSVSMISNQVLSTKIKGAHK